MIIWLCLRWWYGAGWQWAWRRTISDQLRWCIEAFSIPALIRTWFAPFKQTFAGGAKGSVDMQFHALMDNIISRVIGSIARSTIIFTGLVCAAIIVVVGLVLVVAWPLVPLSVVIAPVLWLLEVGA